MRTVGEALLRGLGILGLLAGFAGVLLAVGFGFAVTVAALPDPWAIVSLIVFVLGFALVLGLLAD